MKYLLITYTLLLCTLHTTAQDAKVSQHNGWYEVKMERLLDRHHSRAALEWSLLNDARLEAVVAASGVEVHQLESVRTSDAGPSEDFTSDYLFLSFQESAGRIVQERPARFSLREQGQQVYLSIVYEAKVAVEQGRRDPGFGGSLHTSQPAYRIGDTLKINVESTRDAALYLFNLLPDGQVNMIWPNQLESDARIPGRTAVPIPRNASRYSYVAEWPEERPRTGQVQEALLAVLFAGEEQLFDPADAFVRSFEIAELNQVLMNVPRHLRTELMTSYGVTP